EVVQFHAGAGHRVSFLRMLGRFEESHGGRLFLKQAAYLHHMAGRDLECAIGQFNGYRGSLLRRSGRS
ncbi:MAG: hypothetical protein Q8S43_03510, partial [Actinomycetota bacterium]|nr:hypothetical protein [Actinomycetota bacterium]